MNILARLITTMTLFLCVILPRLPAQEPIPIDFSQAVPFKIVWSMRLEGGVAPISFLSRVCDFDGLDVVSGGTNVRGLFVWKVAPILDTSSIDNTLSLFPSQIDYDGSPPLEYLNLSGHVLKCSQGASPFPLMPIDTLGSVKPIYSDDVDGDGYLDVLCNGGDGVNGVEQIVWGGPSAGKGWKRVFAVGDIKHTRMYTSGRTLYRSHKGGWVRMQFEGTPLNYDPKDPNSMYDGNGYFVLYDVEFVRDSSGTRMLHTKRAELKVDSGYAEVVVDTFLKQDICLVYHITGSPRKRVTEQFDVSDRTFVSTGKKILGQPLYSLHYWGYSLGTNRPVVWGYVPNRGTMFFHFDEVERPFASMNWYNSGVQPVSGMVAINDQTGDGKPDILVTGGGNMILLTLDPAVIGVGVEVSGTNSTQPTASIQDTDLVVHLKVPATVSAQLTTLDGRVFPLLAPVARELGTQHFSIATALQTMPKGAVFIRVQVNGSVISLPLMR